MFEESLLESAHLIRTQSRWPAFASFTLQAAIAATIIIIPILHPEVAPLRAKLLELTAPPPPTQPSPPPPRVHVDASSESTAPAPVEAPVTQAPRIDRAALNPNRPGDTPPSIGNIVGMGSNTPSLVSANSSTGSPAIVVAAARPERPKVSTGVSAGLLLSAIQPIYPTIAKAAGVQGTVTVHAIISKTGAIESASATNGPIMLRQAALDAIRMARYRPYLLNGLPTEVDTTFSVNFRLNGSE
ncbi:MAG TPA: TonB family protein [Acidobacteriaceae bacterium]